MMNAPTPITAPEVCGLDLSALEHEALAAIADQEDDAAQAFDGERTDLWEPAEVAIGAPTALRLISDLRAANTALLREQLRASVLLETVKTALARVDAATAGCPINSPARVPDRCPDRCPRCGADYRQNCGPNVSALDALAAAAREAIAQAGAAS